MSEAKSLPTPMVSNLKLKKIGSDYLEDHSYYRFLMGALWYATITRHKISYSVKKACRFLSAPLEIHWIVVKRILRYLRGPLHHGLLLTPINPHKPLHITVFSDAYWSSDPDDRNSTSGSCVYLVPNLVSWLAKKHTLLVRFLALRDQLRIEAEAFRSYKLSKVEAFRSCFQKLL
ncbi:hypothetical protein KIW84_013930 [Lathyrus oleraceus]|uniref:Uncharacterized protein n=1 Tax=Pisum sativum TaxID=3888 RepID=A0A9D5BLC1_PEA|nr:hypothetical protein KIW84_013930 [Pisum sativum]